MTTGATGQLGLALPVQGELSGTWGDTVNNGITQYTNIAIAATLTLTNDGAVTLANTTGDASASNITSTLTGAGTVTAQFAIVRVTGTLTVAKVVTAPSYSKTYTVVNAATGGIVTFKAAGQTGVSIAVGESAFVYFNGTDYVKVAGTAAVSSFSAGTTGLTPNTATTGAVTLAGTLATTNGGTGLTSFTSGGVVYASSTSALATGSALNFNGTSLGIGSSSYGDAGSITASIGVAGTTAGGLQLWASSAQEHYIQWGDSTTGSATYAGAISYSHASDFMRFWTGSTERMRLDSAGNLSLNTTTPAYFAGTSNLLNISINRSPSTGAIFNASQSAAFINIDGASGGSSVQFAVASAANTQPSEGMRLTSTGLGIGTSSPSSKLDVSGVISLQGTTLPSAGTARIFSRSSDNNTYLQTGSGNTFYTLDGSQNTMYSVSPTSHLWATNNATKMTLDSAGNLGLGVTPSAWESGFKSISLATFASFAADSASTYVSSNIYYNGGWKYVGTGHASNYYQNEGAHVWRTAASGTAGNAISFTQAMTLDASGNLGIGTTSPATSLTVSGANTAARGQLSVIGASSADARITLYRGSTQAGAISCSSTQMYVLAAEAVPLAFYTSDTERARITSDGKLLVGTTTATDSPNSSTSKFVVSGDFTGGFGQSITDTSTNTAVDHYMMSFNLGTASGNQKGYIQFVGASGLILYATTSDQRLKTDLGVVTNTSVIDNLLIHDYTWKESGVAGRGVFAQEAYEVMPNAVGKGKDAPDGSINRPWGVDYSKFIPDLIVHAQQLKKQVQEQQAIIESLKARLDAANL